MNKLYFIIATFLLNSFPIVYSQSLTDTSYLRVITQRAGKITSSLTLTDSTKYYRVRTLIANQYSELRTIHDNKNALIKSIKADTLLTKAKRDTTIKNIEAEANIKLDKLHTQYLSGLSKELNSEQIDKIKDGMTFGKVQFTYGGYINMIPALTDTQKKQIWDWLIEAREKAMDAESSEKKTAIFGKYKGRIANYLSKEGYDLKKEGEEWNKRIKAKEGEKK
jgi:hypothetical protein